MFFSLGPFIRSCDFLQFALFAILQNYASIVLVVYYWRMALEDQFFKRRIVVVECISLSYFISILRHFELSFLKKFDDEMTMEW